VRLTQGYIIPGEKAYDSPARVYPWTLVSSPNDNIVGSTAYTVVSGATDNAAGVATAGGAAAFAGILVDPKSYVLYGNGTFQGSLAPTMILPDNTTGQLATMGTFAVLLTTAAAVDDPLCYNTATGALASYTAGGSVPGGYTAIPNGRVILRPTAANGTAIVELTN